MSRPAILALCAVAFVLIAIVAWIAVRSPGGANAPDSGQPQTPTALEAAEMAQASNIATQAVRETLRQPQHASAGTPRAVELTVLKATRDNQGNWYGKLWTASGTGMTADGDSFTWTAELKHEDGQWTSMGPPEVSLKPQ